MLSQFAHKFQRYGCFPFYAHVADVARIVSPYGDEAIIVALLHDIVEDTSITIDEIKEEFGDFISRCVEFVTDPDGENRKVRKAKAYEIYKSIPEYYNIALIVKVADRLSNVRACIKNNCNDLLSMYCKEHENFRKSAYRKDLCDELWNELNSLVEEFDE